jgi:hypothetical protein
VGKAELPPEGSNLRVAAEHVAEVFGCPVEEALKVLSLGIAARIAEQNKARIAGQAQEDES